MKKLKIYLDTSVIGGCFDSEFALWSNRLMKNFREGKFEPVISVLTVEELEGAPENVKKVFAEIVKISEYMLERNEEVLELLGFYKKRKILTNKFENDMLHIAFATIDHVDVLVSWNFKHIVRFEKIRQFNAANLEMGYGQLSIYSPMEVTNYEKNI